MARHDDNLRAPKKSRSQEEFERSFLWPPSINEKERLPLEKLFNLSRCSAEKDCATLMTQKTCFIVSRLFFEKSFFFSPSRLPQSLKLKKHFCVFPDFRGNITQTKVLRLLSRFSLEWVRMWNVGRDCKWRKPGGSFLFARSSFIWWRFSRISQTWDKSAVFLENPFFEGQVSRRLLRDLIWSDTLKGWRLSDQILWEVKVFFPWEETQSKEKAIRQAESGLKEISNERDEKWI